ncbi:MAG: hypothetical protein JNM66_29720 [Bryobacterales bacterium]|nr:hypothetical protein [Bryobacterales bacterium]
MSAKVNLKKTVSFWVSLLCYCMAPVWSATVGKVVAIGGHAADLALDESRKVLYVANFTANRIEVMSLADNRIQTSINVAPNPGALALSPDGKFLVVTHFGNFQSPGTPSNALTILDLSSNSRQTFAMGAPPLGVAFGIDGRALLVTTTEFLLLDPATGSTQTLETIAGVTAKALPVTTGNVPANIVASSMTASGDGLKIFGLLAGGATDNLTIEFRYDVDIRRLSAFMATSTPPLGPRVISSNRDGSLHLAGWALGDLSGSLVSQFPDPSGVLNIGSHVFDTQRNLIYAQMTKAGSSTAGVTEKPQLQVLEPDNLTVLERLNLQENLSGRSVMSADGAAMYAISESGVTVIPAGRMTEQPRVIASIEDLSFRGNFCDRQVGTQQFTVLDPGGNRTAFQLTSRLAGVTVSPSSGVTPATITVRVDPTVYQNSKGTVTGLIEIASADAVNIAPSVRVLINNKEPDQRGMFVNVPGKLVDILADPSRDRYFVLRQDTNQVLVFDGSSYAQIAALRTNNTPTQLAISFDRRWLMVGHDNSQLISVFDLETLQPSAPIRMPFGHYPKSIASSGRATLVASRVAGPTHTIDRVDLLTRSANTPPTLGIFKNDINVNTVLVASGNGSSILALQPDGTLMLYNANVDSFTISRKEGTSLSGAYAASNFDQFVVGNLLLNASLVPTRQFETGTGTNSGFAFVDQGGFRTTAPNAQSPGIIQRLDMSSSTALRSTRMTEAPLLSETARPFTRTLAPLYSRQAIVSLTTSGITVLPWAYDSAVAVPRIDRIVNAADFSQSTAPGSLISLIGTNLSPVNQASSTTPLPTALGESCLTVNGVPVPMLFASSEQINAQMPYQVDGNVTLILRTPGGVSDNFNLTILPAAPSIFRSGTNGTDTQLPTVIRARNNEVVTVSNPIHWEDVISIYLTGMGNTSPAVEAGFPAGSNPIATPVITPVVQLGGVNLSIEFAGLMPGQVGIYQVNARVPRTVPTGFNIPLSINQGGQSTSVPVRVVD